MTRAPSGSGPANIQGIRPSWLSLMLAASGAMDLTNEDLPDPAEPRSKMDSGIPSHNLGGSC